MEKAQQPNTVFLSRKIQSEWQKENFIEGFLGNLHIEICVIAWFKPNSTNKQILRGPKLVPYHF